MFRYIIVLCNYFRLFFRWMKYLFVLLFVTFALSFAHGQTGRKNETTTREPAVIETQKNNSLKKSTAKNKKQEIKIGQGDLKVIEFHKRMEANAKKYRKMEKEMKKPQYSDPSYFGHKKKPKKRPPGKKKYCKECGMIH